MDPNATLKAINDALNAGDYASAREHADYLKDWLDCRGFDPDWSAYPYAARYFALRHTVYREKMKRLTFAKA